MAAGSGIISAELQSGGWVTPPEAGGQAGMNPLPQVLRYRRPGLRPSHSEKSPGSQAVQELYLQVEKAGGGLRAGVGADEKAGDLIEAVV